MANKDFTNELKKLFADITPEPEGTKDSPSPTGTCGLLRDVVTDLLEGKAATELEAAEPIATDLVPAASTERGTGALDETVASLFADPSTNRTRRSESKSGTVDSLYERTQPGIPPLGDQVLAMAQRGMLAATRSGNGTENTALVAPIKLRGETIGALGFHEEQGRCWTSDEITLVEDVAMQVALAIENVRLFEQTKTALEETGALYRASRAIGSATSIPEIANILLERVADTDFDRGLVLIRREADTMLEVVAGWDRYRRPFTVGALMEIGQISPTPVIYSDKPQSQDGLHWEATNETWRRWSTGEEGISLASVPILFQGLPLGLLLLESREAGRINEKALQPFVTLAAQVAVAIENRRLFEETRRTAEEEAVLNDMLRNLATALTIPAIIQAVQSSLSQLVPFDHLSLALVNKEMATIEVFHPGREEPSPDGILLRGQIVPLQETLTGQAVDARKTIIFDLNDPDLSGSEIELFRRAGAQSAVVVPMVYGDEVLGAISLSHFRRDAYANVDLPLLERVAQLTVVAVENTRLFNQLSQRAVQLQTAAQVSQAATSILNLDQLLNETVELIRERFNLYYVGMFLVDESNSWAVLRAGTGEAGRIQLERGHRLRIGSESMIGWCIANSQARIALDVGEEATRFKNPYLPGTRSELALPLISRNETIGALSVQSTSQAAFSQEDITILQTMADQLANAIQNARFFEQTQKALAETESLYRASAELNMAETYEDILGTLRQHTLLGQSAQTVSLSVFDRPWTDEGMPDWIQVLAHWGRISTEAVPIATGHAMPGTTGHAISSRYSLSAFPGMAQLLRPDAPTLIEDVAGDPRLDKETRALYMQQFGAKSALYIPLVVGSQWIGYVNAIYQQATTFPEPEVRRLAALSSQAAVAVQSLHQLRQIQARARREALIREITSKVRASTDLETILQTTVAEVSRALGTFHGAIRLSTPQVPGNGDGNLEETTTFSSHPTDKGGQTL